MRRRFCRISWSSPRVRRRPGRWRRASVSSEAQRRRNGSSHQASPKSSRPVVAMAAARRSSGSQRDHASARRRRGRARARPSCRPTGCAAAGSRARGVTVPATGENGRGMSERPPGLGRRRDRASCWPPAPTGRCDAGAAGLAARPRPADGGAAGAPAPRRSRAGGRRARARHRPSPARRGRRGARRAPGREAVRRGAGGAGGRAGRPARGGEAVPGGDRARVRRRARARQRGVARHPGRRLLARGGGRVRSAAPGERGHGAGRRVSGLTPRVLRRLANVHHFSRVGHSSFALPQAICPDRLSPDHLSPDYLRTTGLTLGRLPCPGMCLRGLSVLQSIYQPLETAAPSEIPCFAGFFMVFLEWQNGGIAAVHYMLWFDTELIVYVVDSPRTIGSHCQRGN